MDDALKALSDVIASSLADEIAAIEHTDGELCIHARSEKIVKIMTYLRDDINCQFKVLLDVCGVDYPERDDEEWLVHTIARLKEKGLSNDFVELSTRSVIRETLSSEVEAVPLAKRVY